MEEEGGQNIASRVDACRRGRRTNLVEPISLIAGHELDGSVHSVHLNESFDLLLDSFTSGGKDSGQRSKIKILEGREV